VGPRGEQNLVRIRRGANDRFTREVLGPCRFVDLVGRHGWAA
jgi:protein-L-isoaspartate O-methyltransferase